MFRKMIDFLLKFVVIHKKMKKKKKQLLKKKRKKSSKFSPKLSKKKMISND
jgi:hypothetical protein